MTAAHFTQLHSSLHTSLHTYGSSSIADKHIAIKDEEEEEDRKSSMIDEDCEEDDNFTASDDDLSVDGTIAAGKRSRIVTKKVTRAAVKRPHSSVAGSR